MIQLYEAFDMHYYYFYYFFYSSLIWRKARYSMMDDLLASQFPGVRVCESNFSDPSNG